jgi:hypothetical protein
MESLAQAGAAAEKFGMSADSLSELRRTLTSVRRLGTLFRRPSDARRRGCGMDVAERVIRPWFRKDETTRAKKESVSWRDMHATGSSKTRPFRGSGSDRFPGGGRWEAARTSRSSGRGDGQYRGERRVMGLLNAMERSPLIGTRAPSGISGDLLRSGGPPCAAGADRSFIRRSRHAAAGHPTSLFRCTAGRGEFFIPPAFDYRVRLRQDAGAPTRRRPLCSPAPVRRPVSGISRYRPDSSGNRSTRSLSGRFPSRGASRWRPTATPSVVSTARAGPADSNGDGSLALLSARAALSGVPTVAPSSPFLAELLGEDGYLVPADNALSG